MPQEIDRAKLQAAIEVTRQLASMAADTQTREGAQMTLVFTLAHSYTLEFAAQLAAGHELSDALKKVMHGEVKG